MFVGGLVNCDGFEFFVVYYFGYGVVGVYGGYYVVLVVGDVFIEVEYFFNVISRYEYCVVVVCDDVVVFVYSDVCYLNGFVGVDLDYLVVGVDYCDVVIVDWVVNGFVVFDIVV